MANIVHADPFGSAVQGAIQGQQQAIGLATAQRLFRDSDREADFRKWYDPHLRKQMEMQEQQAQLAANEKNMQFRMRMALTGNAGAQQEFADYVSQITGGKVKFDFSKLTPAQHTLAMGVASGAYPMALLLNNIHSAEGVSKTQNYYPFGGYDQPAGGNVATEANSHWISQPNLSTQGAADSVAPKPATQNEGEKNGPWAGPHPTGAFETPGGSGVIEHSYPPTGGGLETGTVAPGSAASTGEAQTYGMGNNQGMENYGTMPGQFQTMFDQGGGSPLVPPSDTQHYNPPQAPQAPQAAPTPAAPGQPQPKAAPVSSKAPAAAKLGPTVAGATSGAATPPAQGMDLTTLLTKLGDVINSHFTGAPAPAPGAPATPQAPKVATVPGNPISEYRAAHEGHELEDMKNWFANTFRQGPEISQDEVMRQYIAGQSPPESAQQRAQVPTLNRYDPATGKLVQAANSRTYNPSTGESTPIGNINYKQGEGRQENTPFEYIASKSKPAEFYGAEAATDVVPRRTTVASKPDYSTDMRTEFANAATPPTVPAPTGFYGREPGYVPSFAGIGAGHTPPTQMAPMTVRAPVPASTPVSPKGTITRAAPAKTPEEQDLQRRLGGGVY